MLPPAYVSYEELSAGVAGPRQRATIRSEVAMRFIDPLHGPVWDSLVLSHPEATFFHSSAWAKVLNQTYGHRPFYFVIAEGEKPLALVPLMEVRSVFKGRRGVCLPFSDFCSPLLFAAPGCEPVLDAVTRLVRERQWKYCEMRGGHTFSDSRRPAATFYGHTLDLRRGAEELHARCAGSVRRALRKAERQELKVFVSRNENEVRHFYRLHVGTRRRHGLPPQPLAFFLQIHKHVIESENGFVVLAENNSGPVAGAVFFHFGKNAVYKFGASELSSQPNRANNLVMWEAIKLLAARKCEKLHFGRTSLDNLGLRRFKLSWGTDEAKIEYGRVDSHEGAPAPAADSVSGFHNKIFRNMPLALNRLAGAVLYPHLD